MNDREGGRDGGKEGRIGNKEKRMVDKKEEREG